MLRQIFATKTALKIKGVLLRDTTRLTVSPVTHSGHDALIGHSLPLARLRFFDFARISPVLMYAHVLRSFFELFIGHIGIEAFKLLSNLR